jgi:hypothetical protein
MDEGMLQSYLDGELSPELMAEAAAHLASCRACAEALGAAEAESSFFASAFAPDQGLSVPSERLRERLDAALVGMETRDSAPRRGGMWGFGALAAWLTATFNIEPRLAGAFASLAALVLLASVFGVVYFRGDDKRPVSVANNAPVNKPETPLVAEQPPPAATAQPLSSDGGKGAANEMVAGHRPEKQKDAVAVKRASGGRDLKSPREEIAPAAEVAAQRSVPGEENYLRTIASLEKVVEIGGPEALKPQMRSEYERNIAVIDRAIEETRRAAIRNPQDADTTSFLFSAYQNKIELLTTVADQAQVATLGR